MSPQEISVLVTLIVYKVLLVAIGLFSQRRTKDGTDFFLGGRRLGPLVAAISASASSSSAWTLLGVSGFAYSQGLAALWLFPSCVGGFVLNWYVVAPALRRYTDATGALTITEILSGPRTGAWHRRISILASTIVLFFFMVYVAQQFLGAGKSFEESLHFDLRWAIVIGAGIVGFYTLLGGFWAVSISDTLQGLLMAGTAVLLPAAAWAAVPGPLTEALAGVDQLGFLSLTRGLPTAAGIGFVVGLLGIGIGYPGQPHVVNRFMALRGGDRELARARWIAIAWAVIVYGGMIILGLCGRVLLDTSGEKVFIAAALELFHPVLAGIMVAAVLSAIMSTADSQLLVAASAATHDLGLGGRDAKGLFFRSRVVVVLLSLGALGMALWAVAVDNVSIFANVLFAWSAMAAAFGPLLVVTVLRGPVPGAWSFLAMTVGLVLTIAGNLWGDEYAICERVVPVAASLAVALLAPHAEAPGR